MMSKRQLQRYAHETSGGRGGPVDSNSLDLRTGF
jgi:hypothetical protein